MGETKPPRDRERELHEDLEDSVAAFVHTGQKIVERAVDAGLRTDVLADTGEAVYDLALHQLQVTNRVLQSSFRIADSLLRRRPAACAEEDHQVIKYGDLAQWTARVSNNCARSVEVAVDVVLTRDGNAVEYGRGSGWEAYHARSVLGDGESTLVRIEFRSGADVLEPGAYLADIKISLRPTEGEPIVRDRQFELHVTGEGVP